MTKEQEDSIEILENTDISTIELAENTDLYTYSLAVRTVLNMLKENSAEIQQKNTELAEKNAEIEKYKKLLADNLAKELNNSIKAKEKADTDLDDLDKGWKVELEKKDKMIDLMAEHICSSAIVDDTICAIKCDCETDIEEDCTHEKMINCTKQYFERKVEDECKR